VCRVIFAYWIWALVNRTIFSICKYNCSQFCHTFVEVLVITLSKWSSYFIYMVHEVVQYNKFKFYEQICHLFIIHTLFSCSVLQEAKKSLWWALACPQELRNLHIKSNLCTQMNRNRCLSVEVWVVLSCISHIAIHQKASKLMTFVGNPTSKGIRMAYWNKFKLLFFVCNRLHNKDICNRKRTQGEE
jgi:hypothetical protein